MKNICDIIVDYNEVRYKTSGGWTLQPSKSFYNVNSSVSSKKIKKETPTIKLSHTLQLFTQDFREMDKIYEIMIRQRLFINYPFSDEEEYEDEYSNFKVKKSMEDYLEENAIGFFYFVYR